MPKRELNKDDTNVHVQLNGESHTWPQPITKNDKKLSKAGSRKAGLPLGEHQLVVRCQILSPQNIHAGSLMQTEEGIYYRNITHTNNI